MASFYGGVYFTSQKVLDAADPASGCGACYELGDVVRQVKDGDRFPDNTSAMTGTLRSGNGNTYAGNEYVLAAGGGSGCTDRSGCCWRCGSAWCAAAYSNW